MSLARTTISMPTALYEDAVSRQHARRYSSFSDYIQDLIRHDIGISQMVIGSSQVSLNAPSKEEITPRPERAVSYHTRKKPSKTL